MIGLFSRAALVAYSSVLVLAVGTHAQTSDGFVSSLNAASRVELGLDRLTADQLRALDEAVERYRKTGEAKVAEAAVENYRKQEEPGVISRAMDALRQQHADERMEKVESRIVGRFNGWDGRTAFSLENGQIWQQTSSDRYYTKSLENPEVTVFKASSGYWRLKLPDGAWVTVKRVK